MGKIINNYKEYQSIREKVEKLKGVYHDINKCILLFDRDKEDIPKTVSQRYLQWLLKEINKLDEACEAYDKSKDDSPSLLIKNEYVEKITEIIDEHGPVEHIEHRIVDGATSLYFLDRGDDKRILLLSIIDLKDSDGE